MRVYSIKNDVGHYQYFLPEDERDWPKLEGDCRPRAASWSPPPVYILRPLHEAGDFYQFGSSVLITSPRATEALREHLEMAGELLRLYHEGWEYTLLNVLECINCLDHEKCEWLLTDEGQRVYPTKYVFHPRRFTESTIFKIPETYAGEILVVEGLRCPEEEFRYQVEQAGLKGLIFKELWRDDSPMTADPG